MKYIIFAICVQIDLLSLEGTVKFIDETTDFYSMTIEGKKDYLIALKKVERYGSFIFVSEEVFNELNKHSDE